MQSPDGLRSGTSSHHMLHLLQYSNSPPWMGSDKTSSCLSPILSAPFTNALCAPHVDAGPDYGRSRKTYPTALNLTPTRELAIQIGESFRAYGRHLGKLRSTVIFGGVNQN